MAYKLLNEYGEPAAIRFIGQSQQPDSAKWLVAVVHAPVEVEDWLHDACSPGHKRYWIKQTNGYEYYRAWYEVVEPDDSEHDIAVKCKAAVNERTCRINVERAMAEYKNHVGVRYGEKS